MVKREDILGVRLSSTERELIEQRAKDDGRTASALVRHIVLSQLKSSDRAPAAPSSYAGRAVATES